MWAGPRVSQMQGPGQGHGSQSLGHGLATGRARGSRAGVPHSGSQVFTVASTAIHPLPPSVLQSSCPPLDSHPACSLSPGSLAHSPSSGRPHNALCQEVSATTTSTCPLSPPPAALPGPSWGFLLRGLVLGLAPWGQDQLPGIRCPTWQLCCAHSRCSANLLDVLK